MPKSVVFHRHLVGLPRRIVEGVCFRNRRKTEMSSMSRSNGYEFPPMPANLEKLNLLSERLASPRLPYMQTRPEEYYEFCSIFLQKEGYLCRDASTWNSKRISDDNCE